MLPLGAMQMVAILLVLIYGPLQTHEFEFLKSGASVPTPADKGVCSGKPHSGETLKVYQDYMSIVSDLSEAQPSWYYGPGDIDYDSADFVASTCFHFTSLELLSAGVPTTKNQLNGTGQGSESFDFNIVKQLCLDLSSGLDTTLGRYSRVSSIMDRVGASKHVLASWLCAFTREYQKLQGFDHHALNALQQFDYAQNMRAFLSRSEQAIAQKMGVQSRIYGEIASHIPDVLANFTKLHDITKAFVTAHELQSSVSMQPLYISVADIEIYRTHIKAVLELGKSHRHNNLRRSLMFIGKTIHNFRGAVILAKRRQEMLVDALDRVLVPGALEEYELAEKYFLQMESIKPSVSQEHTDEDDWFDYPLPYRYE
ncbi:hypothetical protein AK830_g2796 [Neonectria ditissima]|uniref:Uncharacterized protein n=1 Tax=Neonectria ditissima TaxID=78410 RepID=A0A0P7BQT2_9HYPO|nr:hypothetical protein AK830_g2796 [Neonectria ditissima]